MSDSVEANLLVEIIVASILFQEAGYAQSVPPIGSGGRVINFIHTDANFSVVSINGGQDGQHSMSDSVEANLDVQYSILWA
jgi:hypothetical protein